ncbi:uncharacterized protein LOC121865573 [Homarus americanus]|uniref:Uncharacterized protein n=1 Tax=Homarus americanus TaxID=6706 RepID=A0A8J5K4K1_HOMAM|nr:uncharacterized protein LOC121865573 [Homarus americanus]KAG7169755.1 hypothetical protein Hamer_G013393 [Homarus americanus]
MRLALVVVVSVAAVAVMGQDRQPVVEGEPLPPVYLRELPRPWVLGDLPRPVVDAEMPKPWLLREMPPRHYYPYRQYPYYPYNYKNLRTKSEVQDGKGVALHPGGATSFVFPQVHGVGKRSAKPVAEAAADPDFSYGYHSGNFSPHHRYGHYNLPYHNYHNYVYHHQLNKRSARPQYSYGYPSENPQDSRYHGFSYRW